MPIARAGGYTNLATNNSKYIPELFAGKLVEKFYARTVYSEIANTDYEGEIKAFGDTVNIRTTPNITINDYTIGGGLTHEVLSSDAVVLDINRAKSFSFKVSDIDKKQSDIKEIDSWADESSKKMDIAVDVDVLGTIYSQVAAANAGAAAGAKSAAFNLGTSGAPVSITKANVIDYIVDMGTVLDEQNIPDDLGERWLILPSWMVGMIKKSDLGKANESGDPTSIVRNGRIGMIDRFMIYQSNNLHSASGKFDIIGGHKSGLTFAAQMTENRVVDDQNDFFKLVQGLLVYGFEVINDTALTHGVVSKG